MDGAATVLARRRLPEGVAGIAQLHQLIGGLLGKDAGDSEVRVGIETDHGPWAMARIVAGYQVFPVNPQQSARFRARHQVSGTKSDPGTRTCSRTWPAPTPASASCQPGAGTRGTTGSR
jgi:hypothetical protein